MSIFIVKNDVQAKDVKNLTFVYKAKIKEAGGIGRVIVKEGFILATDMTRLHAVPLKKLSPVLQKFLENGGYYNLSKDGKDFLLSPSEEEGKLDFYQSFSFSPFKGDFLIRHNSIDNRTLFETIRKFPTGLTFHVSYWDDLKDTDSYMLYLDKTKRSLYLQGENDGKIAIFSCSKYDNFVEDDSDKKEKEYSLFPGIEPEDQSATADIEGLDE